MKPDRTSIVVIVVMQTGALNDDDTDDSKVFSKDDMGSEDLYPGRTMCLFPSSFNHFLQSHENKKKELATTCDRFDYFIPDTAFGG